MRKIISLLLVMLMVVGSMTVMAAGSADYAVVTTKVDEGKVTLTVTAAQATTSGCITVSYEERFMELVSAETEASVSQVENADGMVTLGYATGDTAIAAEGVIAQVVLAYTGNEVPTRIVVTLQDFNAHEGANVELAQINLDPAMPFIDVAEDAWYYEAVRYVYENNMMNGMTENKFYPEVRLDRAMFVTILGRMAGVSADASGKTGFADVAEDAWYAPYVAWAAENSIVLGTSETTFSPAEFVTREQMATLLYRYADFCGMDVTADTSVLADFADADRISEYAVDPMAWAVENGLMIGTGKGLEPTGVATRAQGAQLFMNFALWAD